MGDEIKAQSALPQFEGMTTIGVLGRGGQATTYETRMNDRTNWPLRRAVKWFVGTDFGDERFNREVAALHRVTGFEGLPEILAEGIKDGHPWIAMNFINGLSVRQAAREVGPTTPSFVLLCGLVLSRALTEVHANGVLHRDINPNNVLIQKPRLYPTYGATPVLIDFGLAILDDSNSQTGPFDAFGTRWFLSPEAERAAWNQTPQSDVYSLAATLVFMLVGETPSEVLVPPSPSENGWIQACRNLGNRFLRRALEACLSDDHANRPTARDLHNCLMKADPGDFMRRDAPKFDPVVGLEIASHMKAQEQGPPTTDQTRAWTEAALVEVNGKMGLRLAQLANKVGLGEYIGPYLRTRASQNPLLWGPFLTKYCHQRSDFVECEPSEVRRVLVKAAHQLQGDPDSQTKNDADLAVSLIAFSEYELALSCLPERAWDVALRNLCLDRLGRETAQAAFPGRAERVYEVEEGKRMARRLKNLGAADDAQWLLAHRF